MAWSDMLGEMKGKLDSAKNEMSNQISSAQGPEELKQIHIPEFPDVSKMTSSDMSQRISQATDGNINISASTIDGIKNFAKGMKLDLPEKKIETPGRSVSIGGMKFDIKSIKLGGPEGINLDASEIKLNQEQGKGVMEQFNGGKSMEEIENLDFENMTPEEQQAKIDEIMNNQNKGMDMNNMEASMKPKFDEGTQKVIDMFTKGKGLK
jgi:hypothetical protein